MPRSVLLRSGMIWILSLVSSGSLAIASPDQSANIRGNRGLLRMMAAETADPVDYQLVQSIEYFTQGDVLGDAEADSPELDRIKGTFGFSLSPLRFLQLATYLEFSETNYRLSKGHVPGGGQLMTAPVYKLGQSVAGVWDIPISDHPNLMTVGLDLALEFNQISRFFSDPIANPTFILTNDWRSLDIPLRTHLNLGFRWKNVKRYFGASSFDDVYDEKQNLFASHAHSANALIGSFGIELPIHPDIIPHIEYTFEKILGAPLNANPNVLTVGIKATPFLLKNLVLFTGLDWGVIREHHQGYPATPLWNFVFGINLQRFGQRADSKEIPEGEYSEMQEQIADQSRQIKKITRDLNLSYFTGVVTDANSGQPLENVNLSFPDSDQMESLMTNKDGKFIHYYSNFGQNQVVFSKAGYEELRRFVQLKLGEKIDLKVLLTPILEESRGGELEVIVTKANKKPARSLINVKDSTTGVSEHFETLDNGHLVRPLKPGKYLLEVRVPGRSPLQFQLTIQPGRRSTQRVTIR